MFDLNDFESGCFFVSGELGAGKTMFGVKLIQSYLSSGRTVATNLDIYPDKLTPNLSAIRLIRIPDKPTLYHFEGLGRAYDGDYDESKFGLIVLDECLTWLNSRAWTDKERQPVINWFLHARKLGWNICFLLQSIDFVDKQVLDPLCTYHAHCRKLAKFKIPVIGQFIKMPKATTCAIVSGHGSSSFKHSTVFYKGTDYFDAYDTRQSFRLPQTISSDGVVIDERASYSVLPAFRSLNPVTRPIRRSLINIFIWYTLRPLSYILFSHNVSRGTSTTH